LSEQCVVQNSKIPFLILDCVNWIKTGNRIKSEGIFRKSASFDISKNLIDKFNKNVLHRYKFEKEDGIDVHTVANLLKLYFRELEEPPIPFKTYHAFISASLESDELVKLAKYKALIHDLPLANRNVLIYMLRLLSDISLYEGTTKLNESSLSILWAPNFLKDKISTASTSDEILKEMASVQNVVTYLIKNVETFQKDEINYYDNYDEIVASTTSSDPLRRPSKKSLGFEKPLLGEEDEKEKKKRTSKTIKEEDDEKKNKFSKSLEDEIEKEKKRRNSKSETSSSSDEK